MATIDIKLKTYEQLEFEIMRLNIDNYLKDKEIDRLNNIIDELEKWVKEDTEKAENTWEMGRCFNMFDILDKLKELKGDE